MRAGSKFLSPPGKQGHWSDAFRPRHTSGSRRVPSALRRAEQAFPKRPATFPSTRPTFSRAGSQESGPKEPGFPVPV